MTCFYYLRHGETEWNALHKLQGREDIPLNEIGHQQAKDATLLLKDLGINSIVASPLLRAKETAVYVATELQHTVIYDDQLQEIDFCSAQGKTKDEIAMDAKNNPDKYFLDTIFPFPLARDAEAVDVLKARIEKAILEHLEKQPAPVLFVGHGGAFLALQDVFLSGSGVRSKNATPYRFYKENDNWCMEEVTAELNKASK